MNTEQLKELGLTDDQVKSVFAMNGADIEQIKAKSTGFENEIHSLKEQLEKANETIENANLEIESFKTMDIDGIKAKAEEWKTKYEQTEAEKSEIQNKYRAESFANSLQFSSNSAKKAFIQDFLNANLPIQNDTYLGAEDFVKNYRESDPGAFKVEETKPQVLNISTTGAKLPEKSYKELSYSEKVELKQNNPDLYRQMKEGAKE